MRTADPRDVSPVALEGGRENGRERRPGVAGRCTAPTITAGLTLALAAWWGCSSTLGPLKELPRELTLAERSVVSSANEFGLDLFARLVEDQPDENVFFSPLSAYLALGMTANGAAGQTLDGMRETLRQADLTEEGANAAYRGLLDLFLNLDSRVELEIANSIWVRLGLDVRQPFVDLSAEVFDAAVRELDFDDPGSVDTINDWVADRTRGRIEDLLSSLDPEDVMFLINAVYFKGSWEVEFDPSDTRERSFERLDGSTVQVPTMRRSDIESIRYQTGDGFEAVELLYGRGAFAMTILLPERGVAPADLLDSVDAAGWDTWMAGFEDATGFGDLLLPKFRLEWEKTLNEQLRAMGMDVAFDDIAADFSRLAAGGDRFVITEVKQKTFVDVNEEGTEAAAATSVGVGVVSAPPSFRVDRPFLFAIRERFSGTILFIGQVLDPAAG